MAKVARVWDGSQWVILSPAQINPYPSQTGNSGKFLSTDGTVASWQTIDLSSKADLNSPTFTGTPLAPTATAGTNTTQIATTAFVSTAVSNLINGAPGALDTLDELAAALGDDSNFASTITTSLSQKQPLDADLTAISGLSGTGFLKRTGPDAWTLDTSTYLTQNQSISISGDATGSGTTSISITLANSGVTANTYGSAAAIPVITVDSKGRVTNITTSSVEGLPSQSGNSGKYLTTNGTTASWGTLNLSSKADLNSPAFTGIPTAPTAAQGTNTTQVATTQFVQQALEITQIDTFTFDGRTTRFLPTYLGTPLEIDHPLRLLLNINGIIQIVAEKPSTTWLSGLAAFGYYIDDDGYIVLPEPPEPGSYFEARLFPGVDLQARPPIYPFKAIDIYLGD
jgi:hypothetical protein